MFPGIGLSTRAGHLNSGNKGDPLEAIQREKPEMVMAILWCELDLIAYELGVDSLGQQIILLRLRQRTDAKADTSNFHGGEEGELTVGDVNTREELLFSMTIPYSLWEPTNELGCRNLLAQGLAIALLEVQALPVTHVAIREKTGLYLGYMQQKHAIDEQIVTEQYDAVKRLHDDQMQVQETYADRLTDIANKASDRRGAVAEAVERFLKSQPPPMYSAGFGDFGDWDTLSEQDLRKLAGP